METQTYETPEERAEATIRALSMLPAADNRRSQQRFGVELDVSISSEHNFYAGFVENMSAGGVFVATHVLKPIGSVIELRITLPGDIIVTARGEVRWIRDYNPSSDTSPGMGVRFMQLDAAAESAIATFLSERDPLFFDE